MEKRVKKSLTLVGLCSAVILAASCNKPCYQEIKNKYCEKNCHEEHEHKYEIDNDRSPMWGLGL
jgi:hypothetical protein